MKLHELHVGERDAGALRDRVAVTGRDDGICRVPIHLTASAGREHRGVGDDLGGAAGDARRRAATLAPLNYQVEDAGEFEHLDSRARPHAFDQRPCDFGAGLVAVRMDDAVHRVRGFAPELKSARCIEIEIGAGGLEIANPRRAFFGEHRHRRRITESGAGGKRVAPMQAR